MNETKKPLKSDAGSNDEVTIEPATREKATDESKPSSEPKYADYDQCMKIFKKVLKERAELFEKLKDL